MSKVRFGIIGLGGMGSNHGYDLTNNRIARGELVAVCDVNPERMDFAKATYGDGVATFDAPEKLFDANLCDAIIIGTPHYLHPPLAIEAFSRGLHVLSEKPAGVYTKQVREMNEAADRSGLKFSVNWQQRTVPAHIKLKELVESGELGEIRRVLYCITNWFRTQAYYESSSWRATWAGEGGGVLINQCPHNIDLWQWICGMPNRVRAHLGFGKYHNIEVEDSATAYVEYPNGASGVFITTTGEAPGTNYMEIQGDRGFVRLSDGKLRFRRNRESAQQFLETNPQAFAAPEVWECEIPVPNRPSGRQLITNALVDAILDGKPLLVDGREGIHSLNIGNAMHLSAWTDDWADCPVDEDLYWAKMQEKIANSTVSKDPAAAKALDLEGSYNLG